MKKAFVFTLSSLMALSISISAMGQKDVPDEITQIMNKTTILKEGDKAADFTADKYQGGKVSLSDYKGKVVLITFWGSWCPPCREELKKEHLPYMISEFKNNKDFVFLPISNKDTYASLDRFFGTEEGRTTYSYLKPLTLMDSDRKIFGLYATSGVPRSVLVGKDGKIAFCSLGFTEDGLDALAAAIRKALR